MHDHERAMLAYVKLADVSQQKQQLPGRDKFLILAGAAACRAGWLDVAARCRELVLSHNPHHLLREHDSFPDALRSAEFEPFLKQLERQCGYERAEHLLGELGIDPAVPPERRDASVGEYGLGLLSFTDQ